MKKVFLGVFAVISLGVISYVALYPKEQATLSDPVLDIVAVDVPKPPTPQERMDHGELAANEPVETAAFENQRHQVRRLPGTDRTPSESRLLSGPAIAVPTAAHILGSDEYGEFIRDFSGEVASNPDALDLTALYKRAAESLLVADDARLISLHCGTTLCAGQIRSNSRASFDAWVAAFAEHKATPHYSFMGRSVNVGIDDYEHRFIFSTDPAANGVTAPMTWVPEKGSGP